MSRLASFWHGGSSSELPVRFQWASNEVPVRFQFLFQAKSQLNNENLITLQLNFCSLHPSKIKGWKVADTSRTHVIKKQDVSRRLLSFVFVFLFFCAARTGKFCHLIKAWGMKTGLLRQHFLPWSVTKPHISPVWLSPQPAPRFYPTNRTLHAAKSSINWFCPKLFHSFICLLLSPGSAGTDWLKHKHLFCCCC